MNVTFLPVVPWVGIGLFASLVLAFTAFSWWRGLPGSWLRGLSGLLIAAALTNPVIHQDEREPLSDIALLIADHSESQKLGNRMAQTDQAVQDLKKHIEELGNTEVRIATVNSGESPENDGTFAFAALDRALGDIPRDRFAGAIMITDGEIHDVPTGKALEQLSGPIHGLITGRRDENDRKLVLDYMPSYTLVGQSAQIKFHVEDQGSGTDPVPITISQAGQEPKKLVIQPGAAGEVQVEIGHAGKNIVSFSAAVRPGELSVANNTAVAVVDGIRDRLKVLLVSGQPNAGERTWRNLLKADSAVDLVHFTILRPPEKQDGTPVAELSLIPFPTKELFIDKLTNFDLVIFDRYQREAILPDEYIANISSYVRDGGALLIASGPDFAGGDGLSSTPLTDVLAAQPTGDITEKPFKPLLTQMGERHPVTQSLKGASSTNPSWGKWFRIIDATVDNNPDTEVLMKGPEDKPLLVLRKVDKGRVAQILSDQGWLWARGYDGGGPQADMLKRIAHWLMKEPELEEERLSAHQQGEAMVIDRYGLSDAYNPISVQAPSGKSQTVPVINIGPGHFQGSFKPDGQGLYLLRDGNLEAAAASGSGDAREQTDLVATTTKLAPAAAATGGGLAWLQDGLPAISKQSSKGPFAGAGWMNLRANGITRTLAIREFALSSSLLALAVLLLAATLTWWREGR